MLFTHDNFTLSLEENEGDFHINLYMSTDNINDSLIYLNLKPLSTINTEFDDKLQIRDIPRKIFNVGDFYQSIVQKHDKTAYKGISLLSIIHDILLLNHHLIPKIKNIYSSSLNRYAEETFVTNDSINFWCNQMNKKPNIPVSYFKKDKRFVLQIND